LSYPSLSSIQNLNQKNLDSHINWPAFLAQVLAAISFVAQRKSTLSFDFNNATALAALSPTDRGTALPKNPVETTLVSEPFMRFSDMVVLDYQDKESSRGVDLLNQQARSIEARILRALALQFFEGSGIIPNLKGIKNRSSQTIPAGGPLTFDLLYELRYASTPSSDEGLGWGGNVWFFHPRAFRKLLSLYSLSITALEWEYVPGMNVKVPVFLGCPCYLDNNISTAGDLTNIYFVNKDNLRILYAESDEYPCNAWGIQHVPIPMQDSVSELGTLVTGIYALQNDPGAIAMLENVNIA